MDSSWIGRIVDGRYVVESVLGEGGMGTVFRARHRFTNVEVALKVLHPELRLSGDAGARFLAEARAPAAIGHPGIVTVTDAGATREGELYLVMELLRGETLKSALERGPASIAFVQTVMSDVLRALGAAHAAGFVHRDLKPENLFLVALDGAAKILDFGIAKVIADGDRHRTEAGSVMGTFAYMSPEQLRDTASVDHRTDLWAAGVIVYEAITGRQPFEARSVAEMIVNVMTRSPVPVSDILQACPPALDAFLRRALAADPNLRFGSAAEMAGALAALSGAPSHRAESRAFPQTALAPPNRPPLPALQPVYEHRPPAVAPARSTDKHTVLWLAGGLALMLVFLGVVGLVFIVGSFADEDAPAPPKNQAAAGAYCTKACNALAACTQQRDPACETSCRDQDWFRRCPQNRFDCHTISYCALATSCAGKGPAGHTSCKAAADCEGRCLSASIDVNDCMCACIQAMSPQRSKELAANNMCGWVQCGQYCTVPGRAAECGTCFALRCAAASRACQTR